jgi:uncharacterized protein (DUF2147 family)
MRKTMWGMILLAALFWNGGPLAVEAQTSDADGTWVIKDLALDIFNCQNLVCGRVVGVRDPRKRTPEVCGRTIVWGLMKTGPATWTNGSIVDPDNNVTYNLSATLVSDDTLRARIYKGVPLFGRTEILQRVAPSTLAGWC